VLTGPGGVGKTRLALRVAAGLLQAPLGGVRETFADGIVFVSLAPVGVPDLVRLTIAQALGVREAEGRPLRDALYDHLRETRALLVLDNFEHLLAAAADVGELLAACSRLKALVTSRAVLRLQGEHVWPVPPLALPDAALLTGAGAPAGLEQLARNEAVRLFVERAEAAQPDFALTPENAVTVGELCRRLDGLPLAIELAAVRCRHLPPAALLARLARCLPLLTGGPRDAPARQQTLRATIAWSYDLLAPGEQALFRRLGIFAGGCTLDAVDEVWAGGVWAADLSATPSGAPRSPSPDGSTVLDTVASLVDKSLVQRVADVAGEPRFGMLETIREFALECLDDHGEADEAHARHAAYFLALAEQADQAPSGQEQNTWQQRLELEHDNLRQALRWYGARGLADEGLRLAAALWWFWAMRGHLGEGRQHLSVLLALPGRDPAVRAAALRGAGMLALYQGDLDTARGMVEQALAGFRALGDTHRVSAALTALAPIACQQRDLAAARGFLEEDLALARRSGDPYAVGYALQNLANVVQEQAEHASARTLLEESMEMLRSLAEWRGVSLALHALGTIAQEQGDYAAARAYLEEGAAIVRRSGNRQSKAGLVLANLGMVAAAQGDHAAAARALRDSLSVFGEFRDRASVALGLERLARLAGALKQPTRALRLAGAAAALRAAGGVHLPEDAERNLEAALMLARQALGEVEATAAWAEGHAMSLDQAIAFAQQAPLDAEPGLAAAEPRATSRNGQPTMLTPRELEVAALVAQGRKNREIAAALVITPATAASHVLHIHRKLGFTSRAQVAAWAAGQGLAPRRASH
jgi:predicted ATPase/DNA-binding CsgD family transcriptional regulator